MSAGGSADGAAAGAVSSTMLLALGIVGGLICIYLGGFLGDNGSVIAAIGAVLAIVWGADAIRRVASYGLGTGVPSIGYMSLSVGVISALAGISLATILKMTILGPVFALVIAIIIGAIIAIVATKIVGMKIPIMLQCTIEIAGAACLSILAFSTAIAGSFLASTASQLYNRAFFLEPNDEEVFYDKRHLFTMSGEQNVYNQGITKSPVFRFRGMNIKLIVCYDLRFPVFCRNVKKGKYGFYFPSAVSILYLFGVNRL